MLRRVSVGRALVLMLLLVLSVSLASCGGGGDVPSGGHSQNDDDDGGGDIIDATPTIVSDPSNKATLSVYDLGEEITYKFLTKNIPEGSYVMLKSDGKLFPERSNYHYEILDEAVEVAIDARPSGFVQAGMTDTLTAMVYNPLVQFDEPLTESIDVQFKGYPSGSEPRLSFVYPEKYIQEVPHPFFWSRNNISYTIEYENLPLNSTIKIQSNEMYLRSPDGTIFEQKVLHKELTTTSGTITVPVPLESSFKIGDNESLRVSAHFLYEGVSRNVLDENFRPLRETIDVEVVSPSSIGSGRDCEESVVLGDMGGTKEYTFTLTDIPEGGGFLHLGIQNSDIFKPLRGTDSIARVYGGNSTITYTLALKPSIALGSNSTLNVTLYRDSSLQHPYYIRGYLASSHCSVIVNPTPRLWIDNSTKKIPLSSTSGTIDVWASNIPSNADIRLTISSNNIIKANPEAGRKHVISTQLDIYRYTFNVDYQDSLSLGETSTITATIYKDKNAATPLVWDQGFPASDSLKIIIRENPVSMYPQYKDTYYMEDQEYKRIYTSQANKKISYYFEIKGVPKGGGYVRLNAVPNSKIFASVGGAVFVKEGDSSLTLDATTKSSLTVGDMEEMTASAYTDSSFSKPLLDANGFPVFEIAYAKVVATKSTQLGSSSSNAYYPDANIRSGSIYHAPSLSPSYADETFQALFEVTSLPKGSVVRLTMVDNDDNIIAKILDEKRVVMDDDTRLLSFNISLSDTLNVGDFATLMATVYESESTEHPMKSSIGSVVSDTYRLEIANPSISFSAMSVWVSNVVDVSEPPVLNKVNYRFDVSGVPQSAIIEVLAQKNSKIFSTLANQTSAVIISQIITLPLTSSYLPGDEESLVATVYSDDSKEAPVLDSEGLPLSKSFKVRLVSGRRLVVFDPVIEVPIGEIPANREIKLEVFSTQFKYDGDSDIRIRKQSPSNTVVKGTGGSFVLGESSLTKEVTITLNEGLRAGDSETLRLAAYSNPYSTKPLRDYNGREVATEVTIKIVE